MDDMNLLTLITTDKLDYHRVQLLSQRSHAMEKLNWLDHKNLKSVIFS